MKNTKQVELVGQMFKIVEDLHKNTWQKTSLGEDCSATPLQMFALLYLLENPQSTVGSLGTHLCLSSSATAQLTDRLVTAGLIERNQDPTDRRAVLLVATKKGEKTGAHLMEHQKNIMGTLLKHVPEKDLEEIVRILTNLQKSIKK